MSTAEMAMNPRIVRILPALLLSALPAGSAAWADEPAPDLVEVPPSIVAEGIPAIPRSQIEDLKPYENIRTATFADWHPTERRALIRTRFGESVQIHEVAMPMGARTQLTFLDEPVSGGRYRPGSPRQIAYLSNQGGTENDQIFILDRETGRTRRLTDGKHRHQSPLWSHDGKLLAYTGNARNGRDFDLYVIDPEAPGSGRLVAELPGSWVPVDWSPDNRRLLLSEYISANESYFHWVDVASGKMNAITPRPRQGEPTVAYGDAVWSRDGRSLFATSDRDSEFMRLVRLDVENGRATVLTGDIPWDVENIDLSDDGKVLAFFANEDGVSKLRFLDTATGRPLPSPELPAGVAQGLIFRRGTHEVGFALSWARAPSDVYSYDVGSGRLERWTASEAGGLNTESFSLPQLVRYPSFDGRPIPAFVYKPSAARFKGPYPVYINIHGGPEGQAQPNFLGSFNYMINELGVAMIYPNVRGSTGYGKSFLKLDNGRLREDSVKDIGALLDWIKTQPDLDASRVMVAGGSYGGYMVLAALTHYSDRLCCGFDSVGISNFVTFLEKTQDYRRDLRREEYGDERDPEMKAFLLEISPANRADRIRRPILVAQGANDPRVPLSESDQIVAKLKANGVPVWYIVAKDEGHGFQKKTNTDYQRAVLFEFMRRHLVPDVRTQAGK
jgi:dipeptidyl aminopeptidase/acylaminoacyl peptidase